MSQKLALTFAEAGHKISCSRSMLYRLIAANKLRSIHIGGRHLIPSDALDALVREAG
jgi:excisionase family DNA binding protein